MKKTILVLLVSVFFGFQFAQAQSVETKPNVTKSEVRADADQPVQLIKTDATKASGKACCSKGAAKACCASGEKASGKSCSSAKKASCSHSSVKTAANDAKTEEEAKPAAQ